MPHIDLVKAFLVFFAVALIDSIWTLYIIKTNALKAKEAGMYSTLIYLCGGFATITYVGEHVYLIPASIGAFIGTWAMITYVKKKNKKTAL